MPTHDRRAAIALLVLAMVAGHRCSRDGAQQVIAVEAPAAAIVELLAPAPAYQVGERFTLAVAILSARDVASVPFHLHFDPNVVQFQPPAEEGPFLGADGTQTIFLAVESSAGGELVVGMSRLGVGQGAHGSGLLATIEFRAVGTGPCGFLFSDASVQDPQARILLAAFNATDVEVRDRL